MIPKCILSLTVIFLVLSTFVFAQDDDLQSAVEYKINKMKISLNLTDSEITALKPVLKDYMAKRKAVLDEVAGEGVVDHSAVKITLRGLKETEYSELAKVLNEDQLKKWIDKENLMASLNPDSTESTVDDGPVLGANGANFKF